MIIFTIVGIIVVGMLIFGALHGVADHLNSQRPRTHEEVVRDLLEQREQLLRDVDQRLEKEDA